METVASLNASLAGRYVVDREIGAGGMATVYVARDVRHDRLVALKVLKPELGAILGAERFLAEIKVTANLQHPNLLPLFDSGEADGLLFYVMPYVEGESLRGLLTRELQLSVEQALVIATSVASALDYAHRRGVVHRDLKPENILLHEGQPMVADFGIALAVSNAGGMRITQTGLSLGTPQYMSPEQATGDRTIDGRADIYSLGAVLYEMLTGEPPHTGSSAQAVIARVITEKPRAIRATRVMVSHAVEAAVDRALAKLPADRWPTARDFAEALAGRTSLTTDPAGEAASAAARHRRLPTAMPWAIAAIASAVAVAVAVWATRTRAPAPFTTRFILAAPASQRLVVVNGVPVIMAPDGRAVVYSGVSQHGTQLYYRRFDELDPHPVAGTENAAAPFFSRDGRYVGFSQGGQLVSEPVTGGASNVLAQGQFRSPFWTADGDVIFGSGKGIMRLRHGSGEAEVLVAPNPSRGEISLGTPILLPDGQTIIYWVRAAAAHIERLALLRLDTREVVRLDGEASNPLGVIDGYLLFGRPNGTINAIKFDARTTRSVADAVPVITDVLWRPTGGAVASISANGSLVYARGTSARQLAIVDEHGTRTSASAELREYADPAFSPDGRRIAVTIASSGSSDIWTYDIASTVLTRVTSRSVAQNASWTPDGKRIAYIEGEGDRLQAWWVAADGGGPEEPLATKPDQWAAISFAPDGKWAALQTTANSQKGLDIWLMPLTGDRTPRPLLDSRFSETSPSISPDTRLIAYASDESGLSQIYVRPFPTLGERVQVSALGGRNPHWSRDGRLFYRTADSLVAATITTQPHLAVVGRGALFETRSAYSVAPDGKHFAVLLAGTDDQQMVVVLNWASELRAKMGTGRQ